MTFPDTPLPIKVEIAPAGTWINITDYVYLEDIEIVRGSADETTRTQPSSCTFRLNNRDGRFSPRNPNGPYYGSLGRNTPILVSVETGDRFLDVPGAGDARVSDNAQISITGDIDVRFDATLRDWTGKGGSTEVLGKYLITGNQRSWMVQIVGGRLGWRWSADGSNDSVVSSTVPLVADPGGRLAVRITHDVNDGAGGNVVTFYTAPTIDGPWTPLGDPVTSSGTTSIFDSTADLRAGDVGTSFANPVGKIWAVQVFDGINGTVAADVDFRVQDDGDTSFTDDAGLTWTVAGGASVNNQYNRFRGEVVGWPQRWVTGAFDVWVPMRAESLMRRLNQDDGPLRSTLARRIPTDPDVLGYWPMEDGEGATSFASGLPGGLPMALFGDVEPAGHVGPNGSDDLPVFNGGSNWLATVPGPETSAGAYQIQWLVNVRQAVSTAHTLQRFQTTGTVRLWSFRIDSGGVQIEGRDYNGTTIVSEAVSFDIMINEWVNWKFTATQNGADVDWSLALFPAGETDGEVFTETYTGSVGRVTAITGLDEFPSSLEGLSWGHLAVFNTDSSTSYGETDGGFFGEAAWQRLDRLTEEENVEITLVGASDETPGMGAQRPVEFMDLLQECADADRGILTDERDLASPASLKFISRACLYSQPVRLELGYEDDGEVHAPLDPTDDDQYTRNLVTAERERGSSAIVEQEDGPLGVSEVGRYPHALSVNIDSDDRLQDWAGWEVHVGTWDEERYPTVLVRLQAATHLISDALGVDQGSRIRITDARDESTRTFIPPGDIDLQVRGYTERLSQFQWEIEFQCVPARPWDVNRFGDDAQTSDRLDTEGSELSADVDSDDTQWTVRTTSGPTWVDDASETPFSWITGGERVRVAAPGGLVNQNPFFDTSVTGWSAVNCSVSHSTAVVHPDIEAAGSALVTPTGGANCRIQATNTGAGTVNPGGRHQAVAWVWSPTAWSGFQVQVNWRDSGGSLVSTSSGTVTAVQAGEWTLLSETFTAPSGASQAQVIVQQTGTPAAGNIWYAWGVRVTRLLSSLLYDEFGRTVADGWGAADSLQSWALEGTAADFDVTGGVGTQTHASTLVARTGRIAASQADVDLYVSVATAALATGGSLFAGPVVRSPDNSNFYTVQAEFTTTQTVTVTLVRRLAGSDSVLDTFTPEVTHAAGTFYRMRLQATGSLIRAKFWPADEVEPDAWQLSATNSDLTAADPVGLRSFRGSGNTNANAVFRWNDLEMVNPQVFTVDRSRNGIVKSHSSGADVSLLYPMFLAL